MIEKVEAFRRSAADKLRSGLIYRRSDSTFRNALCYYLLTYLDPLYLQDKMIEGNSFLDQLGRNPPTPKSNKRTFNAHPLFGDFNLSFGDNDKGSENAKKEENQTPETANHSADIAKRPQTVTLRKHTD